MMLTITFTTLETFCVFSPDIEKQIDTVNGFVAIGKKIYSAVLVDIGGDRTALPVDAFDGVPISNHFLELENEYRQILHPKWEHNGHGPKSALIIRNLVRHSIQKANVVKSRQETSKAKTQEALSRIDALQAKVQALKKI